MVFPLILHSAFEQKLWRVQSSFWNVNGMPKAGGKLPVCALKRLRASTGMHSVGKALPDYWYIH